MSDPIINPFASPDETTNPPAEGNSALRRPPVSVDQLAFVESIPSDYRGKNFNSWFLATAVLIQLGPIIFLAIVLLLLACCAMVIRGQQDVHPALILAIFGLPLPLAVISVVCTLLFGEFAPDWYYYRRFCRSASKRPNPMVRPDEPELFLTGIISREKMMQSAYFPSQDAGLLALDDARREIRFEGDHVRFRIPRSALMICEAECFRHRKVPTREFWFVRVVSYTQSEESEFLLSISRMNPWESRSNLHRQQTAEGIAERVMAWKSDSMDNDLASSRPRNLPTDR